MENETKSPLYVNKNDFQEELKDNLKLETKIIPDIDMISEPSRENVPKSIETLPEMGTKNMESSVEGCLNILLIILF